MNRLTYVQLHAEDAEGCARFEALMRQYTKELDAHQDLGVPPEFIEKWIRSIIKMQGDADRHLELCYDGVKLIGFLYGKVDHPEHRGYIRAGWGYIMEFFVLPEYRRSGYGREMFHRLQALFQTDGAKQMYLTADPVTGRPFWEAMGFATSGERSPENQLEIYEKTI